MRAEVIIRDDLPAHLRHGIFAEPRTYRAWVRYSGPGPLWTPDIEDIGFMSMAVKLMGVPGPKLMDDEKFTQDLLRHLRADLRLARHARQRAAPEVELSERADLLLLQLRDDARPRFDHEFACGRRPRAVRWRAEYFAPCPTCSARARR